MVPPAAEAAPIYAEVVQALGDHVDLFICETMSSGAEALNAATAAVDHGNGKPVYVSWTLLETPGAGLRSGESIADAFALLNDLPIDGFLFNCTHPSAVTERIRSFRRLTDKPVGGYANRLNAREEGWTLDNEVPMGVDRSLDVSAFVAAGIECVDAGANMIGGCCGVGPEYIDALRAALDARGVEFAAR